MLGLDPFNTVPAPAPTGTQSLLPNNLPAGFNPLRDLIPNFSAPTPQSTPLDRLTALLGPTSDNIPALSPNLPQAAKAFYDKYQQIQPLLNALPPEVGQAVAKFDAQRAQKGQSPLGPTQTANVVSTLVNGKPATPNTEPRADIPALPGNIVNDLRQIVTSIPHLPFDLLHTAENLPQLPSQISTALQTPGGFGKQIQAVSQLPGVNLIPGAYTIGNILAGQPQALLQHPLMAALDVSGVAKELGVTPAITEALQGTRLGEGIQAARDTFDASRAGQALQTAFGKPSRELMKETAAGGARMQTAFTPGRADILPEGSLDRFVNVQTDFLREWQHAVPADRQAQLVDLATTTSARDWPRLGLSDTELGFLNKYRDFTNEIKSFIPDDRILDGEVYAPNQIAKLNRWDRRMQRTQANLDQTTLFTRFNALTNAGQYMQVSPDVLGGVMDRLRTDYLEPLLSRSAKQVPADVKREAIRGYIASYVAHGFDVDSDVARATLRGSINNARDFIRDWQPTYIGQAPSPTSWPARLVNDWMDNNQRFTAESHAKQAAIAADRIAKYQARKDLILPARFEPEVEQLRNQAMAHRLGEVGVPDTQLPLIMDRLQNRQYRSIIDDGFLTRDEFRQYTQEARRTVADMRNQGFDPVFLHKVAPDRLSLLREPRPFLREQTPSSLKERTYDVSPYVKDFTVAAAHQSMELLQQQVNREVLTRLFDTNPETRMFARTRTELEQQYEPAARARADLNPRLDMHSWIDQMLNREWQRITPQHLPEDLRAATKGLLGEDTYIPKPVWRNLQSLMTPRSTLKGIADAPLKAFRISVLALSPRFLFNNLFGHLVETAAGTDFGAFKYMQEARDMMRTGELPDSMKATLGSTARAVDILPAIQDFRIRSGTTMGRLWNQIQNSKLAGVGQAAVGKAFNFAQFVDDTTRTMVYLYGKHEALAKEGMTSAEAEAAGEALARKTIQTLDDLTPVERSILRSVFPFYGYMRHVLQFAFHYATDHPFRVAALAAFSRMEQQDWNSGLPELFQSSFMVGKPSVTGDQKMLTLNGLNPWRDLANMFTLAGFASQTNPLISGSLKAMGIDTRTGGADLYPQLTYNAETGTVEAKHTSLIGNIAQSLIPQQNIVAAMIGATSPLRDLMNSNPQAAQRMFASSLGFPLLFRSVNLPQTEIKSELAREQVTADVLHNAIHTGDYSTAARYPSLYPLVTQIRALYSNSDLTQYQVARVNSPNMLVFAQQSLRSALTGVTP